jgi:hypothetical protein
LEIDIGNPPKKYADLICALQDVTRTFRSREFERRQIRHTESGIVRNMKQKVNGKWEIRNDQVRGGEGSIPLTYEELMSGG